MDSIVVVPVDPLANAAIDEIIPRLFLGNADAATDKNGLLSRKISHVVSAAVSDGYGAIFPDTFVYELVDIADDRDALLTPHLARTTAFISDALARGSTVFVHCKVGTSRSVSIVMHFLMERCSMTLREALLHIMTKRAVNPKAPYTHPNRGFMSALIAEEARLRSGDPSLTLSEYFRSFSTGRNLCRDPTALE